MTFRFLHDFRDPTDRTGLTLRMATSILINVGQVFNPFLLEGMYIFNIRPQNKNGNKKHSRTFLVKKLKM